MKKISSLFLMAVASITLSVASGCPAPAEGEGEGEGEGDEGEGEPPPECDEDTNGIDDGACLEDRASGDPELCSGTDCTDPNDVTGNCAGGAGAVYGGGPVITEISEISTGNVGDPCTGGYTAYLATVYSEAAFDTSLNSQRLEYIDEDGNTDGTYSELDLLPEANPIAGLDGYYTVDFYLCEPVGDGAVTINDNDSAQGNAFCIGLAE